MTKRIFRSTLLVAAVVLLCSLGMILGALYTYFNDVQLDQLGDELRIAAAGTEQGGLSFLQALDAGDYRLTWVAADGTVLYDTSASADHMENHADRQEIRQALETGSGSVTRYSATALERTVYEAVRLADGSVLRISMSQQTMLILVIGMLHPMFAVAALAIVLSAFLAHQMSKRIVKPLNELDLEHPLQNKDVYDEISPLLHRIHRQHLQIQKQLRALTQKNDEFNHITTNLQEALVLLDRDCGVLSINPAAKRLFSADESCVGKHFLSIDRSADMRDALNRALDAGHSGFRMEQDGRFYQLDLSRICSDGDAVGAAVLAFDITDMLSAERSRREFSANVSHELKTPLQSIIGSAELLETGLVKPEDQPRFAALIHKEAKRLVSLIEDIIRLSQLDEGVPLPREEVDLLALARETAEQLFSAAEQKQVSIHTEGDGFTVFGVRALLSQILYNLCDNAIRYNVPGGKVWIHVSGHRLTVSDTGIGIPAEHQSRVFERFYRVDKSHSRATGGTGLGLSIVKHAAVYHNAVLTLESTPGAGTTIRVEFEH